MKKWKKNCLIGVTAVALILLGFCIMLWPQPFVSTEKELTGLDFHLQEIFVYDPLRYNYGGDGYSLWVYKIPDDVIGKLSDYEILKQYPMWSALGFDDYVLVRWQKCPINVFDDKFKQVIERAGIELNDGHRVKKNSVTSTNRLEGEKTNAAKALAKPTSFYAYWYKAAKRHDGTIDVGDVYFYIIDTETKIFYKIASNV